MKKLLLAMCVCVFGLFSIFSYAKDAAQNEKAVDALSWLVTVDQNEIAAADLAKSKTKNADVKEYANMMIKAHSGNLKDTEALSRKLKIKLTDTSDVKSMKKAGKEQLKTLKALKGKEFDNAYIEAMIKGHGDALSHLDQLIADADNPQVKDYLTATREVVKMHLQHAEDVKAKLAH